MKIEKLNENKLKITFDYKELEENNISVHSFLSNSTESQKLFLAILDIANEDLNFDITNSKISYEAISFDNKNFVVFVTKLKNSSNIQNISNLDLNLQNFSENNNSFNFIGNDLLNLDNKIDNIIFYKFENILDVFEFCNFINKSILNFDIKSSLYKYNNNMFFIKINIEKLDLKAKKSFLSMLSEFKNYINFSKLSLIKLEEFSEILIKNNAIGNL